MVLRQVPPSPPVAGTPGLMIVAPDLEGTKRAPPPDVAILRLVKAPEIPLSGASLAAARCAPLP
eukprot:10775739-Alexandrium_andersonii.AAC.1